MRFNLILSLSNSVTIEILEQHTLYLLINIILIIIFILTYVLFSYLPLIFPSILSVTGMQRPKSQSLEKFLCTVCLDMEKFSGGVFFF